MKWASNYTIGEKKSLEKLDDGWMTDRKVRWLASYMHTYIHAYNGRERGRD